MKKMPYSNFGEYRELRLKEEEICIALHDFNLEQLHILMLVDELDRIQDHMKELVRLIIIN